jgi:hypothetical protein
MYIVECFPAAYRERWVPMGEVSYHCPIPETSLWAGAAPDRLKLQANKTDGLAKAYVRRAPWGRYEIVVEVTGYWQSADDLHDAFGSLVAEGRIPIDPHIVVYDESSDGSISSAQAWWCLPKQAWVWLDKSDPRWRHGSVDIYEDVIRMLGRAVGGMIGVTSASTGDIPVVMSPFARAWMLDVYQQSDFLDLRAWARALRAGRQSGGGEPPADVYMAAYWATGPIAKSALRNAEVARDPEYLAALGDRDDLAKWIVRKVAPDVAEKLGVPSDHGGLERLGWLDVQRGIRAAAEWHAKWWDPEKFNPSDHCQRGRFRDEVAGLPASAARAASARLVSADRRERNAYLERIAAALVIATRDGDGSVPKQSAIVRATGIPKQTVSRYWSDALTIAQADMVGDFSGSIARAQVEQFALRTDQAGVIAPAKSMDADDDDGILRYVDPEVERSLVLPEDPDEFYAYFFGEKPSHSVLDHLNKFSDLDIGDPQYEDLTAVSQDLTAGLQAEAPLANPKSEGGSRKEESESVGIFKGSNTGCDYAIAPSQPVQVQSADMYTDAPICDLPHALAKFPISPPSAAAIITQESPASASDLSDWPEDLFEAADDLDEAATWTDPDDPDDSGPPRPAGWDPYSADDDDPPEHGDDLPSAGIPGAGSQWSYHRTRTSAEERIPW